MAGIFPEYYASCITEIKESFLQQLHIKAIWLDIDNTISLVDDPLPTPDAEAWIRQMQASGYILGVVSNNDPPRVEPFARSLGLYFRAHAQKPSPDGYRLLGLAVLRLRGVRLLRRFLQRLIIQNNPVLGQEEVDILLFLQHLFFLLVHGFSSLRVSVYSPRLWRTASYSRIAAAALAFREEIWPLMGMLTRKSQFSRTRRLIPLPSLPMTMAAGPFRSAP